MVTNLHSGIVSEICWVRMRRGLYPPHPKMHEWKNEFGCKIPERPFFHAPWDHPWPFRIPHGVTLHQSTLITYRAKLRFKIINLSDDFTVWWKPSKLFLCHNLYVWKFSHCAPRPRCRSIHATIHYINHTNLTPKYRRYTMSPALIVLSILLALHGGVAMGKSISYFLLYN